MQPFICTIAYDGTNYQGWQEQPGRPTIAGALQQSFRDVFGAPIKIVGASRTDAGVHAQGQTARFFSNIVIDPNIMLMAWNRRLPADIVVTSLALAHAEFHPHRNVHQKEYNYVIYTKRPSPMIARYGWWYDRPLDLEKLQQSLALLVGTHDFRSFCTGDEMTSTIRTIDEITMYVEDNKITIKLFGPSFLRYMIRRIVGACVTISTKPYLTPANLQEILQACNPQHCLPTAPACGLTLMHIMYQQSFIK